MNALTQSEQRFLDRRIRLLRFWPAAAGSLLLLLASLAAWMLLKTPHLINPYQVARQLTSDQLPAELMQLMALFLPVCVVSLLTLTVLIVMLGFAVSRNEKRYQRIITSLQQELQHQDQTQ